MSAISAKRDLSQVDEAVHQTSPPGYEAATAPHQHASPQHAPPQVVLMQPAVTPTNYGPHPQNVVCPSCHARITTQVKYENSMKTHLIATILCVSTCCCCIPYMMDSCKNANHHCTSCGAYLGTYGS